MPMSHTGPFDGELQYRQTTGQKQQSGSCNLGAVANAFAVSLLLYTVVMLEREEGLKRTLPASETIKIQLMTPCIRERS